MKIKVPQIGQRIESEREAQTTVITPACATTAEGRSAVPRRYVGVDAGYVKSTAAMKKGAGKFGVIAVKTVEEKSRCHAYVQGEVDNGSERIVRFVEQGEDSSFAALTFFTDAGADIKAATSPDGKNCQRILDWFHLVMYFQIALRIATPLKNWRYNEKYTISQEIERIKWKLWHGQHHGAIERLWLLASWIGLHKSTRLKDKLANRLFDLFYYLDSHADCLVHYSKRKQNDLPISSAMAESVVNQIISRRFVKKQQMRWAPKSAHQLLQVRTAVLNDELLTGGVPNFV